MAFRIPNLPIIVKRDPKLGEALKAVQSEISTGVTSTGNKQAPSKIANPMQTPS